MKRHIFFTLILATSITSCISDKDTTKPSRKIQCKEDTHFEKNYQNPSIHSFEESPLKKVGQNVLQALSQASAFATSSGTLSCTGWPALILCIVSWIAQSGLVGNSKPKPEPDYNRDIEQIPYKKTVCQSQEVVLDLLHEAEKGEFNKQVAARILLFRVKLPEPYAIHFQKGLDKLYPYCFDTEGNFYYHDNLPPLDKIFKKWHKKRPANWTVLAPVKERKYKKYSSIEKESKYYNLTYSHHNQTVLNIVHASLSKDFLNMRKALLHTWSKNIQTIYDRCKNNILANNKNEYGIVKDAQYDPAWKELSNQEKKTKSHDTAFQEELLLRQAYQHELYTWLMPEQINVQAHHDSMYQALDQTQNMLENPNYRFKLLKNFVQQICTESSHMDPITKQSLCTHGGILKKYQDHPFVKNSDFNNNPLKNPQIQQYINYALAISEKETDYQTQDLASLMLRFAHQAHIENDDEIHLAYLAQAEQIFNTLTDPAYKIDKKQNRIANHQNLDSLYDPTGLQSKFLTSEKHEARCCARNTCLQQTINQNYQQTPQTYVIPEQTQGYMLAYGINPDLYHRQTSTPLQHQLYQEIISIFNTTTHHARNNVFFDQQEVFKHIAYAADISHNLLVIEHIQSALHFTDYCWHTLDQIEAYANAIKLGLTDTLENYIGMTDYPIDSAIAAGSALCSITKFIYAYAFDNATDPVDFHATGHDVKDKLCNIDNQITKQWKRNKLLEKSPVIDDILHTKYIGAQAFHLLHNITKTATINIRHAIERQRWYKKIPFLKMSPRLAATTIEGANLEVYFYFLSEIEKKTPYNRNQRNKSGSMQKIKDTFFKIKK